MLSLWEAGAARVSGLSLTLDASWRWEPSVLSDTGCQLALGARRPVPSKLWHSPPPECPIASTGQDRLTPGSSHLLECPITSPLARTDSPLGLPTSSSVQVPLPSQDRLTRGSSHLPECLIASPLARTDSPVGLPTSPSVRSPPPQPGQTHPWVFIALCVGVWDPVPAEGLWLPFPVSPGLVDPAGL